MLGHNIKCASVVMWVSLMAIAGVSLAHADAGVLYAYNKQNPRWETEGRGPVHQFHKPYRPLHQPPGALPPRRGGARHASLFLSAPVLLAIVGIIAMSVGAEWLSWSFHIPSTLLLLIFGFVAGPATGAVDPDALLGNLLLPAVSLSLALLLFRESLRLRIRPWREVGRVMTVGLLVVWGLGAVAAHAFLGFTASLAALLGAILIMTAPPVIVPGLRPDASADAGDLDVMDAPALELVGCVLALLVFEAILTGGARQAAAPGLMGIVRTIIIGGIAGALATGVLLVLVKRGGVPEVLEKPIAMALVLLAFAGSHLMQEESGFLTVIVMGLLLGAQRSVSAARALERLRSFGDRTATVLGPLLLVVLAARLRAADVALVDRGGVLFVGALVLLVRPLGVIASTLRSSLSWRERCLLACTAPRGIVAASLASIMALRLFELRYGQAELLLFLTFVVVAVSVAVLALAASPVGRWLTVSGRRATASSSV